MTALRKLRGIEHIVKHGDALALESKAFRAPIFTTSRPGASQRMEREADENSMEKRARYTLLQAYYLLAYNNGHQHEVIVIYAQRNDTFATVGT